MKKYAIELVFDEESQNKINNIRGMLSSNGVHDEAVPINHVSIADFETDDLDELNCDITYLLNESYINPWNEFTKKVIQNYHDNR